MAEGQPISIGRQIRAKLSLLSFSLLRRKPRFILRAACWFFQSLVLQKRRIRGVMLSLHYRCNFKCKHCYEESFVQHSGATLNLADQKKIIDKCHGQGLLAFDFIGGESHLHPHFAELVRYCQPEKHYISLCTNGYGFTAEKVRHFKNIGIDKFNISLDSFRAEEHDTFRRKDGAHAAALETVRLCRESGLNVTISVVIFKDYTADAGFRELVDFVVEHGIRLACKLAVPLGRWQDELDNLVSQADVDYIHQLHAKYPFITRDIYGNAEHSCPAFKDFFTVTAYGDVMPCNAIHVSFGNLLNDDFDTIWAKVAKVGFFKKGYPGCPSAQSPEFIKTYLAKITEGKNYPARAEEVFDELR